MQLFAWLKADSLSGCNIHLRARTRIAANSSFTGTYIEDAEAPQFDAITVRQSLLQALENSVDSGLGFHARQTGPFNHMMNDVLFNQRVHPES